LDSIKDWEFLDATGFSRKTTFLVVTTGYSVAFYVDTSKFILEVVPSQKYQTIMVPILNG
jgi:hypothetical protein